MAGIFKAYDIRGIYGEGLDESIAFKVGYCYRDLLDEEDLALGPKIVVGRDMRSHSPSLVAALKAGLRARGVEVLDIGLTDTPQNYFAIAHLGASGGIQVTASHNSSAYNGLKMSRRDAIPVSYQTGIDRLEAMVAACTVAEDSPPNAGEQQISVFEAYTRHILSFMDEGAHFKVAADAANGMGTIYQPIFDQMNVELLPIFFELDGSFPNHEANPLKPKNLRDVQAAVLEHGCDFGVSFDGDADRAMFIDEKGEIVTADLMTALLAPRFLRKEPGAVIVYDLRSSWTIKEAIAEAGGRPVRERVGHSFIKATMRQHDSPFGGELAGHFYFRDNSTADCSMLTVIHLLNHLREYGKPLSELVAPLRRYHGTGETNFHIEDKQAMIDGLAETYSDGEIDFVDGITVQYEDWWFNVRPSNTEPLLRLVLEAKTAEQMNAKRDELLGILGEPE